MGTESAIGWTRSTFNPWLGCTKIGPGCDACYAETLDKRHKWGGATHWGAGVPRHRTSASYWKQPLVWNRKQQELVEEWSMGGKDIYPPEPWRVFCASLADVFDNEVPAEWRRDLFELIGKTPNLSWLLVTKRIGNAEKMIDEAMWSQKTWPRHWAANNGVIPNIRILITVVNQEEADRDIQKLLALPYQNGVSYEPALGPVDWRPHLAPQFRDATGPKRGIEWIIAGGESSQGKHRAREFNVEHARSTIRQCKPAGVPVYVKQLGRYPQKIAYPGNVTDTEKANWHRQGWTEIHEAGKPTHWRKYYVLKDRAGADPTEWPEDLRVQEFPL